MKKANVRLLILLLFVMFVAVCLFARLIYLQFFMGEKFEKLAHDQQTNLVKTDHKRGMILDKKRVVLAGTVPSYSVYANPRRIVDKSKTADALASILDIDRKKVYERLSKDKAFVWIKRKIERADKKKLEAEGLKDVGFLREYKRFYPQETLAAHLLGMVDVDSNGIEGLELAFDKEMRSHPGEAVVVRDSKGKNLPLYRELRLGNDGYNLELNIDAHIQFWTDEILKEAVGEAKAKGGAVVIMNPKDGRVLAISNYPTFDPNNFRGFGAENFRNRAISDYYEPGSVFKVLTLVAALENIKRVESKKYDCENGKYKIPGSILHDWKPFGNLSFEEVFMNSSNIGVAKIVKEIGARKFATYIKKFEFGKATGVDMHYETPGYVKPYSKWSKTSPYIIPMGQEIAVSLLQLVRMFSTVVNGGYLVKPFIVNRVVDNKGVLIKDFPVDRKGPIISSYASDRAKHILHRVVSHGTGRRARVKGVEIGGKTGTAQKVDPKGGYSKKNFYATFIGFFPVDDPEYVIGVTLDEPHGKYHSGGMVAAPLFQKIADKIADYAHLRVK